MQDKLEFLWVLPQLRFPILEIFHNKISNLIPAILYAFNYFYGYKAFQNSLEELGNAPNPQKRAFGENENSRRMAPPEYALWFLEARIPAKSKNEQAREATLIDEGVFLLLGSQRLAIQGFHDSHEKLQPSQRFLCGVYV